MKKTESTLVNMLVVLTLITVLSGVILGVVYSMTKDKLGMMADQKKQEALRNVLPAFDKLEAKTEKIDGEDLQVYYASQNDQPVGVAVETFTTKGFGGEISLIAGFKTDGSICNITILKHNETPGLGSKLTDPSFLNQFKGKNAKTLNWSVKKDKGDVDAITAATISSRAFCDAMNKAVKVLN